MCRAQIVLLVALFVGLAHSWDMAFTADDRIEFYTFKGMKTETVRFSNQHLTALAYDEVRNTLLYVDKQGENDSICGYSITFVEYKCYIEKSGRIIQGLAFDPVTDILYFTDLKERSINWYSFKPEVKNNVNGNLLIKWDAGIPTDIVVDSCRGYIYWINRNVMPSTIERARLDGSGREVIYHSEHIMELHSLAIHQQTQRLYFIEPWWHSKTYIYSTDLNGNNKQLLHTFYYPDTDKLMYDNPNAFAITKDILFQLEWCTPCNPNHVWRLHVPAVQIVDETAFFGIPTDGVVGIAVNYKHKDQIQGISGCYSVPDYYNYDVPYIVAREHQDPFCANGVKIHGKSLCKCPTGYTGVRCETSVCENYCFHGYCSITEGFPRCSCNAGYSGDRCELNLCHNYCSNNGICTLKDKSEPVCQCIGSYKGQRCEVSACENYCFHGQCSYTELGLPKCSCDAGYSGIRCGLNLCNGYCANNGICTLNDKSEPVCQCKTDYSGQKCEVSDCLNYCVQGKCSYTKQGLPKCSCNSGYSGDRCEVNLCNGYCLNNGICTLNGQSEPVCQCKENYSGQKCEVSDCLNYCVQGKCSYTKQGLPKCSCNSGYSGDRCEVNLCNGYCLNNGICTLNGQSEPVCQCKENYSGQKCEVSDCLNYCVQGKCIYTKQGLPTCSCNAGYTGDRCEVNVCHGYCLNGFTCTVNGNSQPACQCKGDYLGDRCEVSVLLFARHP